MSFPKKDLFCHLFRDYSIIYDAIAIFRKKNTYVSVDFDSSAVLIDDRITQNFRQRH